MRERRTAKSVQARRGAVTAVLVPIAEWERLQPKKPTLKELLLSDDYYRGEIDIPPRGKHKHRAPVAP